MFVDRAVIRVEGGRGGNGCVSFRREKFVPRGGPDGGDGGHGGAVIVTAADGCDTLMPLVHRKLWKGNNGEPGGSSNCHGKNAHDLIISVPPGTMIYDNAAGHLLRDLSSAGDTLVAAHGGHGGKGNARFKTAVDRAPRRADPGGDGETRVLRLELKLIADVGLIGKPNAGKSTLLSRMSRARPEIADYPFTTKVPNLGLVQVDMDRSFVMADIPGLIEGAHEGHGLGHEFLRHVERTRVLVHLVEPMPMDATDPVENYRTIREELRQYTIDLTDRPEILVMTKSELPDSSVIHRRLCDELGQDVLAISAVTGQGLDTLRHRIANELAALKQT